MRDGGKPGGRANRSVLLVDDEHDIREVFEAVLRYDGYDVLSCCDGQQALDLLRRGARPDAIILDLMMPVMDGWQFRVAQKADPALASIPVIAVSADRTAKAAAIAADVYLAKPVDVNALLAALDRLLLARERESLKARLVETDRLTSLGTIAASVAHEINNPLSYSIANLELVTSLLAESAGGRELAAPGSPLAIALADSREGLLRIRSIVRDLRTFSRPADDGSGPVDVERVLDSSANIVSSEIHHRARLIKDYSGVPGVLANEARLGQVFLNLIVNAAQSIPEGHAEANEIRLSTRHDDRGRVIVEVSDTGEGIAPDLLAHIFEPFFTTKPQSKGTGLGLSICKSLVERFGGTISVESIVGKGSVFRMGFPEVPAGVEAAAKEPAADSDAKAVVARRSRVLVVDDEPRLCAILGRLLGSEHDVTTLTNAAVAAERIANGERFDVIFSDLMMPGMSGMDLHAELHRIAPDQAKRMVFLTGGAFTPKASEFMSSVRNRFLDKPFDYAALSALARELALQSDE